MEKIITGVVGYGFSGRIFQCPFVEAHEDFLLKSIVSRHSDQALMDYPSINLVRSYEELLEDETIELVVITTPSHLHFEQAKMALKKGKHVLVEKPYTATYEEALELNELADDLGLFIGCYQNRRYDGDFLTLKHLKERGVLDHLVEVDMTWDRYKKVADTSWKEESQPGVSLVYDLGSHLLDQALTLFGEPVTFSSIAKKVRQGSKIVDWFQMSLDYEGFVVRIKSSLAATYKEDRYRFLTEDGAYVFHEMGEQEGQLLGGMKPDHPDYGDLATYDVYGSDGTIISQPQVVKGNYLAYYSQMAQAIRGLKEPEVKKEESARLIKYLEAVEAGA